MTQSRLFFPIVVFFLSAFAITSANAAANVSNVDSLSFFYQRTIYLENLCQQGAWWANPATIASYDKTHLFTSNIALLGGKYSISTVRILFPVKSQFNGGFGITGTGTTQGLSASGTGTGGQFNSKFSFTRPSLEAGISYTPPLGGTLGALLVTGTESVPRMDTGNTVYFFWGISAGWLSPAIMNSVRFSFSTLSVYHAQFITWWDNCAKAGVLVNVNDGLVIGSLEYGFSLDGPVSFFRNQANFYGYEAIKGNVSVRIRKIAGVLIGFSKDTRNFRDNGSTFHTGIELRRSTVYPFSGGYEMGMNFFASRYQSNSPHVYLLHRFWVGYDFIKNKQPAP
jgi:hypothetical protein